MKATFSMLKNPRPYTHKDTGEKRVAHNIEVKIPGEGTGDLYISKEVYDAALALNLKDGEEVEVVFRPLVYLGKITPVVGAIQRLALAKSA